MPRRNDGASSLSEFSQLSAELRALSEQRPQQRAHALLVSIIPVRVVVGAGIAAEVVPVIRATVGERIHTGARVRTISGTRRPMAMMSIGVARPHQAGMTRIDHSLSVGRNAYA